MASINDVAKRAQVAKSTVSLVINNTGYVSEETRQKVEQVISELNYQPSQLGRNLSKNRTDLIGIIIPDILHPFYGSFVKYAEESLYHLGYKTVICATVERDNMEQEFLNMLKRRTMDGVIMGAHSLLQEQYKEIDKPVVAFDRDLGEKIPLIQSDHVAGGRMAAERLLAHGCKRAVQISGARVVNTPAHQYHISFAGRFAEEGLTVEEVVMPHNAFREEDFALAAREVFDRYPDVDGILGADLAVLACMKEARKRNISVPGQVKMIAYDGTAATRAGERTVDAVVQPVKELACACSESIDHIIKKEPVASLRQIFPVSMQMGETVCADPSRER